MKKIVSILKFILPIIFIYLFSLLLISRFKREGFKSFDHCKNMGYPFPFCINIPFNSEGLYQSWNELEKQ